MHHLVYRKAAPYRYRGLQLLAKAYERISTRDSEPLTNASTAISADFFLNATAWLFVAIAEPVG